MDEVCTKHDQNATKKSHYDRLTIATKVMEFEHMTSTAYSERAAANEMGIPRTTLRHWGSRLGTSGLPQATEAFLESPEGHAFLHRLMVAAKLVIVEAGGCGIRALEKFLQLTQLDHFVASSVGALQKQMVDMEEAIIAYEQEEKPRLVAQMPHKNITVAQDETFHPEICLVAIEPVSDFILVERYSEKRDCASWAATMNDSLAGLPVTVVQSTSDEGPGLLKYASGVLGAQHSPDIFHVQQEITRGTAASLNAQIRHTEAEYAKQCKCMNNHMTSKALLIETAIPSGKMMVSVDRDIKIAETQTQISLALQELETAHLRKQAVQNAKKALSDAYRPYDIITGKSRTTEEVHIDLEEQYSIIMEQAKAASLSEQGHKHLQKAHRVFDKMLSTLAFFWSMVVSQVAALGLSAEGVALMHNVLIAMYYLEISAKKAKGAVRRKEILDCVQQLREELERSAVWSTVDEEQRKRMRATARECAQLFQRSSSCVEGRNGYLSFRHHGLHHLSSRKLRVLGILHNYYVKRSDHSTAAGRFFESEPKDLFESLLNRLPMPARPRSKGGRSALVDGFQEAA